MRSRRGQISFESAERTGDQSPIEALVTGAPAKGTWARLTAIPAEGRVERGFI